MENEVNTLVKSLKNKTDVIISLYEKSLQEIKVLEQQKSELMKMLEEKDLKIDEVEDKHNKLKLAKAFESTSTDSQEAKARITKIVREIDKCIALLNR